MKKRFLLTIGAAGALVLAGAAPAFATDAPDSLREVFWAMSDGGTAEHVTWPQTHLPDGVVPCGVTAQVDTYPESKIPGLIADGLLMQGEDTGVVQSWRFVYGGDCVVVPEQPADIVTGASSESLDCVGRVFATSTTETRTTHTYDEATNTWVAGEPVTTEVGNSTRPATEAECPTAVTVDEPADDSGVDSAAVLTAAETPQLAQTGPVTGWMFPVGAGLVFVGLFLLAAKLRRSRV